MISPVKTLLSVIYKSYGALALDFEGDALSNSIISNSATDDNEK